MVKFPPLQPSGLRKPNLHPIVPHIPDSHRGKEKQRQGRGLGTGPPLPQQGVFSYLKQIRFGRAGEGAVIPDAVRRKWWPQ